MLRAFLLHAVDFGSLNPEGPSTQHLRTLVPNTINALVCQSRDLEHWALASMFWLDPDYMARRRARPINDHIYSRSSSILPRKSYN